MVAVAIFNGFCVGLERTKHRPVWAVYEDEGWGLAEFSGFVLYLGFIRFMFGSFEAPIDVEDLE